MGDFLQVSARAKPRSRRNKRSKSSSLSDSTASIISIADIFDVNAREVLVDNNDVIVRDVIEEGNELDYELNNEDHVLEYTALYERSRNGFQKSLSGSHSNNHNTPKIVQCRQQLLNPHKWKHSVKKQEAIAANRNAAKQNVEKLLERKGLHRQGPAVFQRAWSDQVEDQLQSKRSHKSKSTATNPGDCPAVLLHALQKSDVKKSNTSSHLLKIADMQHRDITPEDYELLLQLDDDIAPKTVSQELLNKLETGPPSTFGLTGELCSICMEQFKAIDLLKKLHCGHCFHSPCVDQWLTYSSCACPLDGLPVVQ